MKTILLSHDDFSRFASDSLTTDQYDSISEMLERGPVVVELGVNGLYLNSLDQTKYPPIVGDGVAYRNMVTMVENSEIPASSISVIGLTYEVEFESGIIVTVYSPTIENSEFPYLVKGDNLHSYPVDRILSIINPAVPDVVKYNPDPTYLRELVECTGLSQRGCARILGVSERSMREYLKLPEPTTPIPYSAQFSLEQLARGRLNLQLAK